MRLASADHAATLRCASDLQGPDDAPQSTVLMVRVLSHCFSVAAHAHLCRAWEDFLGKVCGPTDLEATPVIPRH